MIAPRAVLACYNALLVLISPLLLLKKWTKYRAQRNRHEVDRARWAAPPRVNAEGRRVVLLGLSWGEVAILDQISRRLDHLPVSVIWAIRDGDDAARAQKAFPTRVITTMPFDFALPTKRWLDEVRPDFLVIIEKFWWPNLVWSAKLRGARVVLVNGRSRGRDRARYRLLSFFQLWVLSAFDLLLFESESQIARVADVLPRHARFFATGNVKFAFNQPSPPSDATGLTNWLQNGASDDLPLLIAGSTSPADEDWAFEAWQSVQKEIPCRLLLAPRRIERAPDIAADAQQKGFSASLRSASSSVAAPENHAASVLILGTLGELSFVYQFGVAAYVGGSIDGRGHNIIEPLAWGKAVAYGPNRGDFEAVQRLAEDVGVGFRLRSSQQLAEFWRKALLETMWRDEMASRAARLLQEQSGALEAVVDHLETEISSTKS